MNLFLKRDADAGCSFDISLSTVSTESSSSEGKSTSDEDDSRLEEREETRDQMRGRAAKPRITGRRRQRAALIHSLTLVSDLIHSDEAIAAAYADCTDANEGYLESTIMSFDFCFHYVARPTCDIWSIWGNEGEDATDGAAASPLDTVAVAVEATAICEMDLSAMKQGENSDLGPQFVCGGNCVGVVHHCDLAAIAMDIKPGCRVASIANWRTNSRFVSIPPKQLLVVPKHLDAADIACLISSYLPAFEALHHGRTRPYRFSRTCLAGRRVLITGGATAKAQAIIRLARLAGAEEIYVIARKECHALIEKMGAVALHEDPVDWLREVQGSVDIIIDYAFPCNFSSIQEALSGKGRLVCIQNEHTSLLDIYMLFSMGRGTLLDFGDYFEKYRDGVEQDVQFLLQKLEMRQIRPQIDRYVALKDIPAVQMEMTRKRLTGTIVCEPWKV